MNSIKTHCIAVLLLLGIEVTAEEPLFTQSRSDSIYRSLLHTLLIENAPYYSPVTHAYHNCPVNKLATLEQVRDLNPNPVGYGSGIDDCALYGGTLLVAFIELYEITGDRKFRDLAHDTYLGLRLLATAHGVKGYVTRGVHPADASSTYITSSRDQYTHFVDGLWHYYHSPIPDKSTKVEIKRLLAEVAETAHEQVIPGNDYSFLRGDGTKDPRGLHRMWNVYAHEAARLPMIYAAAWDVTGNPKFLEWYLQYADEAVRQSNTLKSRPLREVNSWVPTYSFYQMQCSLELMYRLENDPGKRVAILEAMTNAMDFSNIRFKSLETRGGLREFSEIHIAQTMNPHFRLDQEQKNHLVSTFNNPSLDKGPAATTIHLLGAYSKAVLRGLMPAPSVKSKELRAWVIKRKSAGEIVPDYPPHLLAKNISQARRVVFIADPHVGLNAPEENNERFAAAVEQIVAMHPDAVLILGDLSFSEGTREDYLLARQSLLQLDNAGIPWKICFGESDNTREFFSVFSHYRPDSLTRDGKFTGKLITPRADFLLLDSRNPQKQKGQMAGEISPLQAEWLRSELNQYRISKKAVFIVTHHPAASTGITRLGQNHPSVMAFLSGHQHKLEDLNQQTPREIHLISTAWSEDGAPHQGFTYLQLDKWEFVFRPVTFIQDDVWSRRSINLKVSAELAR